MSNSASQARGRTSRDRSYSGRVLLLDFSMTERSAISGALGMAGYATIADPSLPADAAVLNGTEFLGKPTRQGSVVLLTEQGGTSFREALALHLDSAGDLPAAPRTANQLTKEELDDAVSTTIIEL